LDPGIPPRQKKGNVWRGSLFTHMVVS
jgi:hypothetical protein